jgi:hypothetical protein
MDEEVTRCIRNIFLSPSLHHALLNAATLLGISLPELRRAIAEGSIVAVPTRVGLRVPREELIAAAMRTWRQDEIEEALGDDAAKVLPEAIRLVELRAWVPRYQREMLDVLARRNGTTIDVVLMRELEDVACAHAEELALAMPGLEAALAWPERIGART